MERPGPRLPAAATGIVVRASLRRRRAEARSARRPSRGDWLVAAVVVRRIGHCRRRPAGAHAVPAAMDPAPNARLDALAARGGDPVHRAGRGAPAARSRCWTRAASGSTGAGPPSIPPTRGAIASGCRPLPDGAYTVSWRVLSADDGHVTSGAHVFTGRCSPGRRVGESGPTVRSGVGWRPLARWLVGLGGRSPARRSRRRPAAKASAGLEDGGMERPGRNRRGGRGRRSTSRSRRGTLAGVRPMVGVLATLLGTPPGYVWTRSSRAPRAAPGRCIGSRGSQRRRRRAAARWLRVALAACGRGDRRAREPRAAVAEGRWLALGAEALHLLAMASWVGRASLPSRPSSGARGAAGDVRFPRGADASSWRSRPSPGSRCWRSGPSAVSGLILAQAPSRGRGASWSARRTAGGSLAKIAVFAAMLGARRVASVDGVEPRLTRALAPGRDGVATRCRASGGPSGIEAALGLVALGLAGALGVDGATLAAAPTAGARRRPRASRHERVARRGPGASRDHAAPPGSERHPADGRPIPPAGRSPTRRPPWSR